MPCIDCPNKNFCSEYYSNGVCDKSYYEWLLKLEKCEEEAMEQEVKANENRF